MDAVCFNEAVGKVADLALYSARSAQKDVLSDRLEVFHAIRDITKAYGQLDALGSLLISLELYDSPLMQTVRESRERVEELYSEVVCQGHHVPTREVE